MNMKIVIPFLALMGSTLMYGQGEIGREPVVRPMETAKTQEESPVRQEDEPLILGAYREIDPESIGEDIKELIRSLETEDGAELNLRKAWIQIVAGQRFLVAYDILQNFSLTIHGDIYTVDFEPVLAVAEVLKEPDQKPALIRAYRSAEIFDLIQRLLLGERRQ
jgi:hypothetical protein